MKRLLVILILLTGCVSSAERPLRVMVFNIHAGKDAAGVDNLERVAALIRSSNADLVLLQEVDRGTTRSGGVDQLAVLMRLTDLRGVFGKSLDYQGGEYGIATLSRWSIAAHEIIRLRVDPPQTRAGGSLEPRIALVIETRGLRVLNTHLDASQEDTYRLQEIERLLERKSDLHLAGGDFNSVPESTVQEKVRASGLRDAWLECGATGGLTYPADTPVKRIDYLFLSPGFRCGAATVLESTASDHRPLIIASLTLHK